MERWWAIIMHSILLCFSFPSFLSTFPLGRSRDFKMRPRGCDLWVYFFLRPQQLPEPKKVQVLKWRCSTTRANILHSCYLIHSDIRMSYESSWIHLSSHAHAQHQVGRPCSDSVNSWWRRKSEIAQQVLCLAKQLK
jgi:hypothetical protein